MFFFLGTMGTMGTWGVSGGGGVSGNLSRPEAGSADQTEVFGRRRRPRCDAREARLAEKLKNKVLRAAGAKFWGLWGPNRVWELLEKLIWDPLMIYSMRGVSERFAL